MEVEKKYDDDVVLLKANWRVDFVLTSRFHTSYVRKAIARIATTTIQDLVLEVVFRAKYVQVKVGIVSTKVRGKNIKSH